ncbi:Uncharacterized protein FWK35_00004754 [Aphis craccivora]|uniref:Reverse transcriptase domain-containing protein n=1 Tax=Aphis craccivora TaxID=307492 RepID=A0A6G0ZDE8_APHCR|nr:Uncharacterized protein FWK35_00004754 [Aphis craccivora]
MACYSGHLARVFFNIYNYDLLKTISKKLIYANDICIATQCKNISLFHLNNRAANQELIHNKCPVYSGITRNRTSTYKHHLEKIASTLKTRAALISKLADTTWGANTQVLRTSTQVLLYSVAEYCSTINRWGTTKKSSHNYRDSRIYNIAVVTGLGQYQPPYIRQTNSIFRIADKIHNNPTLMELQFLYSSPATLFLQD